MYSQCQIIEQLRAMGVPQDSAVLVHSSLRAVGEVEGRGEGLLEALIAHCTARGGLLCIPTHTWANPTRPDTFKLDMQSTQTCIGTLPNLAAAHPRGVRTSNPTHSMAVFGDADRVAAFIEGEERLQTPTNPHGCYGKLCELGGSILLVGVGHERNTYLHSVEEMLDVPNRLGPQRQVRVRLPDGRVEERTTRGHHAEGIGDVSKKYPKYEAAFRAHGCIVDGKVGDAPTMLCAARGMRDVLALVRERSGGTELLVDDTPLDAAWYL